MTARRLRRPLRLAAAVAALALTGTGLAGCGQKGPLYLPGESPQQVEPGIPTDGARPGRPQEEEEEDAAAER
jgi:predicted small lipoprotein YifL